MQRSRLWGVCLDESPHPGSRRTRRVRFECHMGSTIPTRTICRYIGVRYFRLARAVPVFTPEWVWAGSPASGSPMPDIWITQPDGSGRYTIHAQAIERDTQSRHADHPPWWEWTPPKSTQGSERINHPRHADHPAGREWGHPPATYKESRGSPSPDMRITLHDGSGRSRPYTHNVSACLKSLPPDRSRSPQSKSAG